MNEFDLNTMIISEEGKNLYLAIKLNGCLAPVVIGLSRITQMSNYFSRIKVIIKACYKKLTMLPWNFKYSIYLNGYEKDFFSNVTEGT